MKSVLQIYIKYVEAGRTQVFAAKSAKKGQPSVEVVVQSDELDWTKILEPNYDDVLKLIVNKEPLPRSAYLEKLFTIVIQVL